ncbi:MAG: response regulator transcription factor [Verrucomicrobiia bacterium]
MDSQETCAKAPKKRVLLVDDHAVVRMGLTRLINEEPDLVVCGEAEDEGRARAVVKELRPDVAVVDWSLRDKDASSLITTLSQQYPQMPVLVLSVHEKQYYAEQAIRAGARGYVMKHEATEKLIEAIRRLAAGQTLGVEKTGPAVSTMDANGWTAGKIALLKTLTEAETNVLRLIAHGYSPSRIAELLQLRLRDLSALQENVRIKLQLRSVTELFQTAPRWIDESYRAEHKG